MMLGSKGILPPTDAYELLRCKAAHAILGIKRSKTSSPPPATGKILHQLIDLVEGSSYLQKLPVGFGNAVDPKAQALRKTDSFQRDHRKNFFHIIYALFCVTVRLADYKFVDGVAEIAEFSLILGHDVALCHLAVVQITGIFCDAPARLRDSFQGIGK